jgi:hypothetical protein
MGVENKLKAMGLEPPAARTPPPGRAGAVKIGNLLFVGGRTPGPGVRGQAGDWFHGGAGLRRGTAGPPQLLS